MGMINVEVAYALPDEQCLLTVEVPWNSTIVFAVQKSGILQRFPQIDLQRQTVGVFGKIQALSDIVQAGDRIEIYRALQIDPKEARRQRAKKK